jgi:UDP-N-acetylmuramoyl-tripeptide--D-alanyl-D-alanine ligase
MLISEQILERAGIEVRGDWDEFIPSPVSIHSAESADGLFWALPGASGHGERYVQDAFGHGAKAVAVTRRYADKHAHELSDRLIFVMEETLSGLQQLATEVRRSLGSKFVAITGSNGKTTTRELLAAALSTRGKTASSHGNYNNHIGVPLTILNLDGDEVHVVVEMGANHVGEIARLCEIAHPEVGLITNIGDAHVGEFGGHDEVERAKGELFQFLADHDGLAIVNLDDERVVRVSEPVRLRVGFTLCRELPVDWNAAIYQGEVASVDEWSRVAMTVEGITMPLQLAGRHWAQAALAAYTTAVEMGADYTNAFKSLAAVEPLEGRGKIHDLGDGIELMDDSYNANAAAVESALKTLACRPGRRIAVLADMLELGSFEEAEHRKLGRLDSLEDIDAVFFVGPRMAWAAEEARTKGHEAIVHIGQDQLGVLAGLVYDELSPGAGVVLKGSRKLGLEQVIDELLSRRGLSTGEGS